MDLGSQNVDVQCLQKMTGMLILGVTQTKNCLWDRKKTVPTAPCERHAREKTHSGSASDAILPCVLKIKTTAVKNGILGPTQNRGKLVDLEKETKVCKIDYIVKSGNEMN